MNLRTLRLGIKISPTVAWAELTWLHRWARHPERYPLDIRYKRARKLTRRIINLLEIDVKFNNVNILNNQNKCFLAISNHRHFIDPLLYLYYSEKPIAFLSKLEASKMPFIKDVMKVIDCLYIDRDDIMGQVRVFKTIAERLKNNQMSYFIFPEGTRMKDKTKLTTLHYKDGSLKPAFWGESDIIPFATYGSDFMLDRKNPKFKKRNITIEGMMPIKYEDFKNNTTTQVMPKIEAMTNETIKRLYKENNQRNLKVKNTK